MRYSAVGFLVTLTLSLLTAPLAITAQPRGKIPRVAVLDTASQERPTPCLFAFQQGLRDFGYVEGQTIRLDYRYAEGHVDQLPALAAELVQLAPDVLWTNSDPAAWAAKRTTTTIPIVIGVSDGLVEQGLVASHARPGGNLSGLELPPIEVVGKRLELFKEAVPTISRVAVLGRVDELLYADPCGNEMNKSKKGMAQFLIAHCNASKLFEFVEEPFDLLA